MSTILRYSRSLDGTGEQNYQMICTRVSSTNLYLLSAFPFFIGQAHIIFLSKLSAIPRNSHTLQRSYNYLETKYITNTVDVYKLWFHM